MQKPKNDRPTSSTPSPSPRRVGSLPPLPDIPRGSPAVAVAFYDPRLGAVMVASHNPDWVVGQVVDVTLPHKRKLS